MKKNSKSHKKQKAATKTKTLPNKPNKPKADKKRKYSEDRKSSYFNLKKFKKRKLDELLPEKDVCFFI